MARNLNRWVIFDTSDNSIEGGLHPSLKSAKDAFEELVDKYSYGEDEINDFVICEIFPVLKPSQETKISWEDTSSW